MKLLKKVLHAEGSYFKYPMKAFIKRMYELERENAINCLFKQEFLNESQREVISK